MPDELTPLIERYRASLGDKARGLDEAYRAAEAGSWALDAREQFKLLTHRLAGSASSYGFSGIGDIAVQLDYDLQRVGDSPTWVPDAEFLSHYAALQQALADN